MLVEINDVTHHGIILIFHSKITLFSCDFVVVVLNIWNILERKMFGKSMNGRPFIYYIQFEKCLGEQKGTSPIDKPRI